MTTESFKIENGATKMMKGKKWREGFNFKLRVVRLVSGQEEKGGVIVRITVGDGQGDQLKIYTGFLPENHLYNPTKLHKAIRRVMPVVGLVIQMSNQDLGRFWAHEFRKYRKGYQREFGYGQPTVRSVECLGWQEEGVFVLNEDIQVGGNGNQIPLEEFEVMMVSLEFGGKIPVPLVTSPLRERDGKELFFHLRRLVCKDAFMAAIYMGGVALQAVHYKEIKRLFHQVPVPILVGQPDTNKTFMAKICASLVGLHTSAVYSDLTMAKMIELLGQSMFFIYNDPEKVDVLKMLITKSYEDGKSSSMLKEMEPNTMPLITANVPVIRSLHSHGMRELSRLVIIPMTASASPAAHYDKMDGLMDQAGKSVKLLIPQLDDMRDRVRELATEFLPLLESGDGRGRIAKNNAILVACVEEFTRRFNLNIKKEEIWDFLVDVVLPKAIQAHQLPPPTRYNKVLLNAISEASKQLGTAEFATMVKTVHHRFDGTNEEEALAVRVRELSLTMKARLSTMDTNEKLMRTEMVELQGRTVGSVRFGTIVSSASLIPGSKIPEELWTRLIQDTGNGQDQDENVENVDDDDVISEEGDVNSDRESETGSVVFGRNEGRTHGGASAQNQNKQDGEEKSQMSDLEDSESETGSVIFGQTGGKTCEGASASNQSQLGDLRKRNRTERSIQPTQSQTTIDDLRKTVEKKKKGVSRTKRVKKTK